MNNKPLNELLHDLEQEMLRLGYTEYSMRVYRSQWQKLLQFSKERNENFYSERLGIDFIEKHFNIFEKDSKNALSTTEIQKLRTIRIIGDFQLHRTILRRCYQRKQILTNPHFIDISNRFKVHCEKKVYSNITTAHYVQKTARFMEYLSSQGITDCKEISLPLIHAYIRTLAGYTYKTVEQMK